MVLNIIGGSGSGKTTLKFALMQKNKFRGVTPFTTRPMRIDEVDGLHYHFVPQKTFTETKFLISRNANGFSYGVKEDDLICANDPRITITTFDVGGIDILMRKGIYVKVVFLDISFQERERRMLLRGDDKGEVLARLPFNCESLAGLSLNVSILRIHETSVAELIKAVSHFVGID